MTTESSKNGATTLSRMNLSEYVGNVTIFSLMFTIASRLVVRLELALYLVCGWLVFMHTYLCYFLQILFFVLIVTFSPQNAITYACQVVQ